MSKKHKAVVFDLDGTLANVKKYKKHHKHRHEGFAKEAEEAPVIHKNMKKLKKAEKKGEDVVIMTARSASYRKETDDWLKKHDVHAASVHMRPRGDVKEKDKNVKKREFEKEIAPKYNVKKAYDDKNKNRKMFRHEGVKAEKA